MTRYRITYVPAKRCESEVLKDVRCIKPSGHSGLHKGKGGGRESDDGEGATPVGGADSAPARPRKSGTVVVAANPVAFVEEGREG